MNALTLWRVLFALLLAFVTWQTLTTDPADTEQGFALARLIADFLFHDEALADKVGHFMAYSALGASAAFSHLRLARRRVLMICALAVYGALLEFVQGVGGVRSPEIADAIANSLGAVLSYPAALALEAAVNRIRSA